LPFSPVARIAHLHCAQGGAVVGSRARRATCQLVGERVRRRSRKRNAAVVLAADVIGVGDRCDQSRAPPRRPGVRVLQPAPLRRRCGHLAIWRSGGDHIRRIVRSWTSESRWQRTGRPPPAAVSWFGGGCGGVGPRSRCGVAVVG
jgi:hypothetical protein